VHVTSTQYAILERYTAFYSFQAALKSLARRALAKEEVEKK
jgi:hypothetical protein